MNVPIKSKRLLGINGIGRIGKLTLWNHLNLRHFVGIVVNAGREVGRKIDDMDLPGLELHELKGNRKGIWSVKVSGNWRITFRFVDSNAEIVHYEDYH